MSDYQSEFLLFLEGLGIAPHPTAKIIFDGRKRRYRAHDDKHSDKSCEYACHLDTPTNGWAKSYAARHGVEYTTWIPKSSQEYSPDERRKYAENMKDQKEKREKQEASDRARGIAKAREIWSVATEPNLHDRGTYLSKKGLSTAHGSRQLGKDIIIPLYNEHNELMNVQTISPDGTKKFCYGALKQGNFFVIGENCARTSQRVFVGEGFATCATVHESTGCPVVVAFDCGNLSEVVRKVAERFVGKLVIASDNDRGTAGNPGVSAALKISEEFNLPYVLPRFKENETGSDFNDYAQIYGIERTAEEIFSQLEKKDTPHGEKERSLTWLHYESTKSGGLRVLPTKENLESLLNFYNITVFYDETKRERKYILPLYIDKGNRFGADNKLNSTLALIRSICEQHGYPTKNLEEFLALIADENRRHPVREWILSCAWDRRDRISEMFDTIQVAPWFPVDFKNTLILRWLVSAVAATFSDSDFRSRGILVLQGRQRLGKTTWLRNLVPTASDWFLEGTLLNPDDKDSVKRASSFWLCELGEIESTLKQSDLNKLKAFITSSIDTLRLPWGREFSSFVRRTVFAGSVNRADFLVDTTGNSRFWTLPCTHINYAHNIDILQLWKQIYEEHYLHGVQHWLTSEEDALLDEMNRNFEAADEVVELILAHFDFGDYDSVFKKSGLGWMNATQTLIKCGITNPTGKQTRRAAEVLRELTGRDYQKRGHSRDKCFWIPQVR